MINNNLVYEESTLPVSYPYTKPPMAYVHPISTTRLVGFAILEYSKSFYVLKRHMGCKSVVVHSNPFIYHIL